EIVGLVPQAALNACSEFYLQIENFSNDLILERRLQAELSKIEPDCEYEGEVEMEKPSLPGLSFMSNVGTNDGTNVATNDGTNAEDNVGDNVGKDVGLDGCGAAAIAGSLAAALGRLV